MSCFLTRYNLFIKYPKSKEAKDTPSAQSPFLNPFTLGTALLAGVYVSALLIVFCGTAISPWLFLIAVPYIIAGARLGNSAYDAVRGTIHRQRSTR